jgi:lipopolysaccharide/colanic/teichoic acid biosynthesis glycosyltransferase
MNGEREVLSRIDSEESSGAIAAQLPCAEQQSDYPSPTAKRCLDLVIAIPALLAFAPVLLLAMTVIWLVDPGKVLFRQVRVGHKGRPFVMLKLRTMYENSDDTKFQNYNIQEFLGVAQPASNGLYRLEHDERVIPIGKFLRRFRVDELPQLVNVVRGEMSLVGPRPLQPWEVSLFTKDQYRRHLCLPGITGLWQVSGQNRLSMTEMLQLDLAYVDERSIWLDLQIIARTIPALLRADTC